MAMTQPMLLFIGVLAAIATVGIFNNWADNWTGVIVAFGAAFLWGIFGISSFNVLVIRDATVTSVTFMQLVVIGVGLAMMTGVYGITALMYAFGGDADDIDTTLME